MGGGVERVGSLIGTPAQRLRLVAYVFGPLALVLFGCGAVARAAATEMAHPPSPADFVGYPSCMLYAPRSDTRVRVRAANIHRLCVRLAGQLGAGWSQRPRRAARILSPICRFADPRGEVELEVIDDATGGLRGRHICLNLVQAGWLDLSSP